jgi:hypothetical protein
MSKHTEPWLQCQFLVIKSTPFTKHSFVYSHMNTTVSNTHKFAVSLQEEQEDGVYTRNASGCGERYKRPSDSVAHMDWHDEEGDYVCEGCELRFKYIIDLCKHKETHPTEKRHVCDLCKKRFS